MTRRARSGIVLVAAVLLPVIGCGGDQDPPDEGHVDREIEHGEEGRNHVELTLEQRKRIDLEIATAGPGSVVTSATFPGEVVLDPDRVAHVAPRVSGMVRETRKRLGDRVSRGDILAVLESRELAEAQAAYLAALSRCALAENTLRREETLWKEKRISSEQEYLVAQQACEEAQIESRAARQRLYALGFTEAYLDRLPDLDDELLTRYEVVSPLDGVVVAKHAVLGELLGQEGSAFTVADLTSVWVRFNVYQKDLALVATGRPVRIDLGQAGHRQGAVSYVSPIIDERTRTVEARVVLGNADGQVRPGLYVTVRVTCQAQTAPTVIPTAAVQVLDDVEVVFVEDGDGFRAVPVELGATCGKQVVVTSGLSPGQRYVARGAFDLKANIVSGGLGAHAGHGH